MGKIFVALTLFTLAFGFGSMSFARDRVVRCVASNGEHIEVTEENPNGVVRDYANLGGFDYVVFNQARIESGGQRATVWIAAINESGNQFGTMVAELNPGQSAEPYLWISHQHYQPLFFQLKCQFN